MRVLASALCLCLPVFAQSAPVSPIHSPQNSQPDPLAVGKAALRHEDFGSADDFFTRYVHDNPQDTRALVLLADAQLGLRDFTTAEKNYRVALERDPKLWEARANLLLVYSESERWKDFDAQRAEIARERAAGSANVPQHGSEMIDVFTVNNQRYFAREFVPPEGRFHVKYNFYWFGPDGKVAGWIACESDDVDQSFFAQKHPAEAAAGQRSYSLDGYTPRVQAPNGQWTQTHSTLKFYSDGEPTYEQVRADVIASVQHRSAMSSTTTNVAPPPEGTTVPPPN